MARVGEPMLVVLCDWVVRALCYRHRNRESLEQRRGRTADGLGLCVSVCMCVRVCVAGGVEEMLNAFVLRAVAQVDGSGQAEMVGTRVQCVVE